MFHDLIVAVALLLVIEGALPFVNPETARKAMLMLSQLNDQTLRFAGLSSMVIGCLLLYAVNR